MLPAARTAVTALSAYAPDSWQSVTGNVPEAQKNAYPDIQTLTFEGVAPAAAYARALAAVKKGGAVVCGGIHMSDIPAFPYALLWEERRLLSVANLTREDAREFLALAPTLVAFVIARILVNFALNGEWALGSLLVAETWPAHLRGRVLEFLYQKQLRPAA